MSLNMTGHLNNSSLDCGHNLTGWEQKMDQMYTYFYLLLFVPGLILNTTALWVLCRHIRKKTKAVIFMINLALADLAHILSLPLRIYYYFTHTWPFGKSACLFCFYLKYLNMYAAIVFLVCISVQRCAFLLDPFSARRWRRRYDLLISVVVWVVVGMACSPFILMRSSSSTTSSSNSLGTNTVTNTSFTLDATSTQQPLASTKLFMQTVSSSLRSKSDPSKPSCFKDLPMRRLNLTLVVTMTTLAELFGFLLPLACITYSSIRIVWSLNHHETQDQQINNTPGLRRLQSVTSNSDKYQEKQTNNEKRRALRMVLSCSALFLVCFAPYHLNFILYMMVSQGIVSHCATSLAVRQFHPVSLCLASLSCCLNPLLYYFLTAEFRMHLTRRTSSFSSSLLSSPTLSSPTGCSVQQRLARMESSCSDRE